MAFNKGILMLAVIALTSIFEATCVPQDINDVVLSSRFMNKCRKNESDSEFDNLLRSAMSDYKVCFTHTFFSALRQRKVDMGTPLFSVLSDFQVFCNATPHIITCLENLFDTVLFCESQQLKDILNLKFSAMRSFGDYMCSEDAKRVTVFVEQSDCIIKSYDNAKCFDEMFSRPLFTAENFAVLEIHNKTVFPKIENCVLNTFDQCPGTDPLFSPSASAQKYFTVLNNLPALKSNATKE